MNPIIYLDSDVFEVFVRKFDLKDDYTVEDRDSFWVLNKQKFVRKKTKRIEAAPAVIRNSDGEIFITPNLYYSQHHLLSSLALSQELVAWPAKWDSDKGIWYYEEE